MAAADPEWSKRLRTWRTQMGAVPGPMEVWLAHRSLATLDVRLEPARAPAFGAWAMQARMITRVACRG